LLDEWRVEIEVQRRLLSKEKEKGRKNHQIPGNPHNIYLPKKGRGYDVM